MDKYNSRRDTVVARGEPKYYLTFPSIKQHGGTWLLQLGVDLRPLEIFIFVLKSMVLGDFLFF